MADVKITATLSDEDKEEIARNVVQMLAPLLSRVAAPAVADDPERMRAIQELSTNVGVSESTLSRRTKDGTIPSIRIGRSVRYHLPSVISALQSQGDDHE